MNVLEMNLNSYLKKHVKNVHEGKKPKQSKISSNHDDFDQMIWQKGTN